MPLTWKQLYPCIRIYSQAFPMKIENLIRILAGTMILLSVALVHFHSPWWLLLTCRVYSQ